MSLVDRIALYNLFGFAFICAAFVGKITLEYMDVTVLIAHEGIQLFGAYCLITSLACYICFRAVSSAALQVCCFILVVFICFSWSVIGGVKLGSLAFILTPVVLIYLGKMWGIIVRHITRPST